MKATEIDENIGNLMSDGYGWSQNPRDPSKKKNSTEAKTNVRSLKKVIPKDK